EQLGPWCKGFFFRHLDRSSQVFAIMAVLIDGTVGWVCYSLAISQYLVVGLVTSRDKALDVMTEFDKQVNLRRHWLADQLQIAERESTDDWMPIEAPPAATSHDSRPHAPPEPQRRVTPEPARSAPDDPQQALTAD